MDDSPKRRAYSLYLLQESSDVIDDVITLFRVSDASSWNQAHFAGFEALLEVRVGENKPGNGRVEGVFGPKQKQIAVAAIEVATLADEGDVSFSTEF